MSDSTDVRPVDVSLHFLPVETRVPLKFGPETLTSVTCARVRMVVEGAGGRRAQGWGGDAVECAVGVARRPVLRRQAPGTEGFLYAAGT